VLVLFQGGRCDHLELEHKYLNQIAILTMPGLLSSKIESQRLGLPSCNLNQIEIQIEILTTFESQRNKYEQGLPLCNYYQIAIQMLFENQRYKYLNQIAILM
jgi:hypothetical protein